MEKKYILALDQGTSSSRAIIFDKNKNILGVEQKEFSQYYPKIGWVEQDAEEIFVSQINVAKHLISRLKISPEEIACIGITNQRETIVVWDKFTGKPIYRAIVWQDKRTANHCQLLKAEGLEKYIKKTTGLVIDSYFSSTKIRWILKEVAGARVKATENQLLAGTIDSWLVWNLTNGSKHITDISNASRTMLFNIEKHDYDEALLNIFGIPRNILPKVCSSSEIFGYTHESFFGVSIPISGIAGDQQAALFGQACLERGMAKNTYGTGCFMLANTGTERIFSETGLLTTIAWKIGDVTTYALEGSVFIGGAAIKWLRDALHLIDSAAETEDIANEVESSKGVIVVPAFSGLGAPYWDMYARGAIFGLTQGVTDKHLVRATLESIAYQTKDLISAMEKDSGIALKYLSVDGGASQNDFLMQFQADLLNTPVIRPVITETTSLGAALLAGLAIGFWSENDLHNELKIERTFYPNMSDETRTNLHNIWTKAVKRTMNWES